MLKKCFLLDEKINDLFPILEDFVKDNSVSKIIIRVSNERSSVMLKVEGEVSNFLKLEQVVDVLIINDKVVFGDDKIISTIGNKKYYVSIDSFFQVNKTLTEKSVRSLTSCGNYCLKFNYSDYSLFLF